MALVNITNSDLELCKNRDKTKLFRAYLLDLDLVNMGLLEGVFVSGDISIDANSETRRTMNVSFFPKDKTYNVSEYNKIWLNKRIKVQIGFIDNRENVTWYDLGKYIFNQCSYTYALNERAMTLQCSDLTTSIDGTHGGVLDGSSFLIKAGNDLKKVVEDILTYHTNIKDFRISTIGEYGCLQGKSVSWKQNRIDTGSSSEVVELEDRDGIDYLSDSPYLDEYVVSCLDGDDIVCMSDDEELVSGVDVSHYIDFGSWHTVPYDLEFPAGTSAYEMIVRARDIYPGNETYFDKDGEFILDLIPSCEHDPLLLDYYDMQPLIIDENVNIDFSTVKNATRIYGKSIEVDRYADNESASLKPYIINGVLKGYQIEINLEKVILASNLKIGFQMPEVDESYDTTLPLYLFVNSYSSTTTSTGELSELYTPYTISCTTRENIIRTQEGEDIGTETVYKPMELSCFISGESYCFQYISSQNTFMYLGMYQIEAYVEDNSSESPFSVDKIGKRLQVLSGGEYDDITDVTLCKERAEYENWKAGRLNDTITLTTLILPFLDVNQKVRYRSLSSDEIAQYIIKNISFSLADNTCSITMSKFYDLYPFIICSTGIQEYRPINSINAPYEQKIGSTWEQVLNDVLMSTPYIGETVTSVEIPENQKEGDIWEQIIS